MTCPRDLADFVLLHTALESPLSCTPLTGGVSSDIYLVSDGTSRVAAKRALAQLKVAAEWHAPPERSASEASWLRVAEDLAPGLSPRLLAFAPDPGWLLLEFLDPSTHPVWKQQLLGGVVDPEVARSVGAGLGRLHSATAARPQLAERFATDDLFDALRLDPYLRALLPQHPAVADRIETVIRRTASTKFVLVHGDVSPKNILVGPRGPMLLDAECAWWGDPAFDVAFLLTHLVAKALHVPDCLPLLTTALHGFLSTYCGHVDWEDVDTLRGRVSDLLPALLLARVDGKSPLEYLTTAERGVVRDRALRLLVDGADLAASLTVLTEPAP
jgi:fructosamine-3-kinase